MPLVLRKFPLQIFRQDTLVLRQCTTVWVCTLVMAIHCLSKCTSYKYKGLHAYIYIYTRIYICLDLDIYMYFFICVYACYIYSFFQYICVFQQPLAWSSAAVSSIPRRNDKMLSQLGQSPEPMMEPPGFWSCSLTTTLKKETLEKNLQLSLGEVLSPTKS